MPESLALNRRLVTRLPRLPNQSWQLRLDEDRLITKNVINISPGGMSFKAPISTEIKSGETLKITISLHNGESFECEGRVLWTRSMNEKAGSMQVFGVKFSGMPTRYDALIMKEMHEFQLQPLRQKLERGERPQHLIENLPIGQTVHSWVLPLVLRAIKLTIIAALTFAFLAAAWIHSERHPEDNIAVKFNDALTRKISGEAVAE